MDAILYAGLGFALLIFILILVINLFPRTAYALYKLPKIHYIVHLFCKRNRDYLKESILLVPHSIMCVIDDMGWIAGSDLRSQGGPSRLITKRNPSLSDYENVRYIAEQAATRLLGLFVLSELDKENVCAREEYNLPCCPSDMTEYGRGWNSHSNSEEGDRIMRFMYENSSFLEFGLHGVRHEHFLNHQYTNAEWANGKTGESWGSANTEAHCKCFEEILRQYFPKEKCAFPVCFVPPSHAFALYSADASILHRYGVKYACSSCDSRPSMKELRNSGAFHDGILFFDRTEHFGVNKENHVPNSIPINAWIGTHFPNYWGNKKKKWINYLKRINRNYSSMLGRNSIENASQWLYTHYCAYSISLSTITLNNLYMPCWAFENHYVVGIWLKVHLHQKNHLSQISIPGLKLVGYYEDDFDNGYAYLIDDDSNDGALKKKIYEGTYCISKSWYMGAYVDLGGETFSILNMKDENRCIDLTLRIFGTHTVRIHLPEKIKSIANHSSPDLTYSLRDNVIEFSLRAKNMMGELAVIRFQY